MTSDAPSPINDDDLQAMVDGRLPADRRAIIEAHLLAHPEDAARVRTDARQREALRAALRFKAEEPIPDRLRIGAVAAAHRRGRRRAWSVAASVMLAAGLGGGAGWLGRGAFEAGPAAVEAAWRERTTLAASAHRIFVADAFRPVEIHAAAGDLAVRWLTNRLGRAVEAPDLRGSGLQFIGGRLIPTAEGPAAQLMYDQEPVGRVTVFLVPEADPGTAPAGHAVRYAEVGGLGTASWGDGRFRFILVAAAGRERLEELVVAVRAAAPAAAGFGNPRS